MVNCSYCNKELPRLVFCNASHKVMYYRKGNKLSKGKQSVIEKITKPPSDTPSEAIKTLRDKGHSEAEIKKLIDDAEPYNRNDPCPTHGQRYWDCFQKHTWGVAKLPKE